MKHRLTILALATALALTLAVPPAHAWPTGGLEPAPSWWAAVVDALASLFGLAEPSQSDGSCMIDPLGNPVCPAPRPATQSDGSCMIDPWGNPVCQPRP